MVVGVSALWQVSRGSRANGYGSCHLARRLDLFGGHGNAEVYPVRTNSSVLHSKPIMFAARALRGRTWMISVLSHASSSLCIAQ